MGNLLSSDTCSKSQLFKTPFLSTEQVQRRKPCQNTIHIQVLHHELLSILSLPQYDTEFPSISILTPSAAKTQHCSEPGVKI